MSSEKAIELARRGAELQKCVDRAAVFFNDVMPQAGQLAFQDYANLNELAILLRKLKSPDIDDETKVFP